VFDIDLIVTDREQSETSPNTFEALERTAQVMILKENSFTTFENIFNMSIKIP
jgi:hypothetical protein